MRKLRFSFASLLILAVLFISCNDKNSVSGPDLTDEVVTTTKSKAASVAANLQNNNQPSVILDGGAYHQAAYFPAEGNFISWFSTSSLYGNAVNNRYGETDDYLEGDAIAFANGAYTNCVLTADGNITCSGYLGDEQSYSGGDAVQFDVGYGFICLTNTNGDVVCKSPNSAQYTPNSVAGTWETIYESESEGSAEWVIVSDYAACYKLPGVDELNCSGWNVTEPNWLVQGTPTPNGEGHYAMCILTEEGDVDCMNNTYNGSAQTAGYYGGDAIAFDADFGYACYVKENGDIGCFGNPSTSITGVNAVDVSISHNGDICYVTADGEITCTNSTPDEYEGGSGTNVYISDSSIQTWDPIFPSIVDGSWPTTVCYQDNTFGLDANWVNPHNAFEVGTHPWEGIAGKTWEANWINSYNSINSTGPGGHNWSKYETTVSGEGDFVVQLLADNCSWVYLDGQLIGYQSPADVSDPNGGQYGVTLNGEATLTFVIFDGGGLAGGKFRLETSESFGGPTPPPIEPTNEAPVADAGADQSMDATGQTTPVTLDGSGSSDADGDALTYSWTLDGNEVSTDASFSSDLADGSYTFTLTVSDGEESDSDEVTVTVLNTVPVADAGADITLEATGPTTPVTLNGSGTDADGDALTYSWSNGSADAATDVDLGVGSHTFTLTVSDGQGASHSDEVTVTITDTTAPDLTFSTETTNLWPPNHKMVLVLSGVQSVDIVDGIVEVDITVNSSEDANGNGDGNTDEDFEINRNLDGTYDVYLRAERSGNGDGRTYTISMTSIDVAGNVQRAQTVEASVPHDQGGGKAGKKGRRN